MNYLVFIALVTTGFQIVATQVLRPPPCPFNPLNRPIRPDGIIETGKFLPPPSPTVIREPPINSIVPIPTVAEPSTTIITDCSPQICKNLANTIQLMIVCNLLQNKVGGSQVAMELATPILNEVLTSPTLSCGCANPFSPNVVSPNLITPNVVSPNFVAPSVVSPVNMLGPNTLPLMQRVISPTGGCPNNVIPSVGPISPSVPIGPPMQAANVNGLLSSLMSILGNLQE